MVPGSLSRASPAVRSVFDNQWAPIARFGEAVGCLPVELFSFLLSNQGGYVAIWLGESCYCAGPAQLRGRGVDNVASISVEELAKDSSLEPLQVLGHLIDHYLGCAGEVDGPWLSQGGGVTPHWRSAGERIPGLFALGYGIDQVSRSSECGYFARSLAWYCRDRSALNRADPQIERWLRNTIWSPVFWRQDKHSEGA
jgi:hypothetical protein